MNEYAHRPSNGSFHRRLGSHPLVIEARQQLVKRELVVEDGEGTPTVPRSVLLHPEGPGVRRDTPWGVFKRLPPSVRRSWLEALGLDPGTGDLRRLTETLSPRPLTTEEDRFLEEEFTPEEWQKRGAFPSLPESLEELYTWAAQSSDPLAGCVLRGRLLPTWVDGELTGLLASRPRQRGEFETGLTSESRGTSGDEEWERMPFGFTQQQKILLVLADGIPFRSTEEDYPYLFDLKEAARLTGWSLDHVQALVRRNLEQNLMASNGERFCLTDAVNRWSSEARPDDLLLSGAPLKPPGEDDVPPPDQPDCSSGRLLWEALRMARRCEGPFPLDAAVQALAQHPAGWEYLVCSHLPLVSAKRQRREAATDALRTLHRLGFLDGVFEEEQVRYLRLNERGEQLLESPETPAKDSSQLPFILQPDGTLMVPLDAPLEDFRRINPFVLIVNVDNMIEYRVDRQSLVQSLNDGWDANAFYRFLSERADRIPDPVQELFDEVAQPAEKVQLERVHHLLRFESGATASKALRALSNYKPERIGEKEILLRSKTTEETIRRNLSRGGVRLQNAEGPARSSSPVLDDPGGDSTG